MIDYAPTPMGWSGYTAPTTFGLEAWKISLVVGSKQFMIGRIAGKAVILDLANEISSFIERKLIDNSAKP